MKFHKKLRLGVSILFLLLIFTASITLFNFTKESNEIDENSISISGPDDNYEPNNNPLSAYDLSSYKDVWLSSINGSGILEDDDYYKINITMGYHHLKVNLSFIHTLGDINVEILDSGAVLMAGGFSITDGEYIDYIVPSDGIYYIHVLGLNTSNNYDLLWDSFLVDDNYEENDDWSSAYDLTPFMGIWLSSVNGAGIQSDEDFFRINIVSGFEHLIVDLMFIHSTGDIDLEVWDSTQVAIAWSSSTDDNENIDIIVPNPGTYYLRLHYGNMGNPYDLWWSATAPVDDVYEENDGLTMAYDLSPWAASWLPFGQGTLFDEDWFKIYLDPGEERVRADLIFNHFAGDINIELYDWNYFFITGSYSFDDNEYLDVNVGSDGSYYLRIFSPGPYTGNTYDLWWEDLSPTGVGGDDWAEENDDFWNARWLDPNYYSGLMIIGGDEDWFQFFLKNGDDIDVDIYFYHGDGDLELELWDPSNTHRIGEYSSNDDEYLSFNADMSGDWRIRVYHAQGNSDVSYELNFWINNGMNGGDDAYEFNDNPYDIIPYSLIEKDFMGGKDSTVGDDHPSNLADYERTWLHDIYGVAFQGNEDWYVIEITPGFLNLETILYYNRSLGNMYMEIHFVDVFWDPLGHLQWNILYTGISSFSFNNSEYVNVTLSTHGIYLIRVFGENNGNGYTFWWDDHKTRFLDDIFETNDDSAIATDISSYENDRISRTDFGVQYNEDYYSLYISEGFQRLRVFLEYDFSEGIMGFEIYDNNLNKITGNFTLVDNDYIDYEVPSNGTYYIRVFGDNSGNIYDLFWEAWENEETMMVPGYDVLILIGSVVGITAIVIKMKRSKIKEK